MKNTREKLTTKLQALYKVQEEICKEIEETRLELEELDKVNDRRIRLELHEMLIQELAECRERLAETGKQIEIILLVS